MSVPSILIVCGIGLVFGLAVAKIIYDKVKGKGSCSGNCAGCKGCHSKPSNEN